MTLSKNILSFREFLLVAGLALCCFLVIAWRIGHPALWYDEHVSLAFTQESWGDLFGRFWPIDTHRPIYYALLKGWMGLVGTNTGAARMLGAVLAAFSVVAVWAIGRILGGKTVGLMAAALSVCSPMFVAQARELRMYPLFTLSLLLVMLALALILRRGETRGQWALFVMGAVSAFYAHSTGLLIIPIAGALIGGLSLAGLAPRRLIAGFVLAAALWFLLILPGVMPMVVHTTETLADFWIPWSSPRWVWSQFAGAYPYPAWAKPIVLLVLVAGLVAAFRHDQRAFWLLLAMAAAMPLMLWGLSYLRPVLIVRAFVWTTLAGGIIMAFALDALRPRLRYPLLAVLVVLQILALHPFYPAERQHTWIDEMEPALRGFDHERDIMVLGLIAFEPNLRWNHPEMRGADIRAFSNHDGHEAFEEMLWSDHLDRAEAPTMPLGQGRVWIVSEPASALSTSPVGGVDAALQAIRAQTTLQWQQAFGKGLLEIRVPTRQ
jgi:mannosyltransferase